MLAHRFDEIGNADVQPYRAEHPREIGVRLKQFVDAGWLEKGGHGRGTRYRWPKQARGDLLALAADAEGSQHSRERFQHKDEWSQHKTPASQRSETLEALVEGVRAQKRARPEQVRQAILALCAVEPLSLADLARLLGRVPASLQNHYLTPMLKEGVLGLLYPNHPNHPQQRYRAGQAS
jgi:ATP-dependent DNA helicase RecG